MEAPSMNKIIKLMTNFIGELYRDLVVLCRSGYIEYTIKKGYFIYKNILPLNFTIGRYKFLKNKDFNTIIR